ncbi:hypothetical protein BJ508DRAFT_415252 [Ascobolus immersus RN42]|uniref:Uncharacterized protein n=1 Tax=Ascobolus immersus RN42 TaxID=1160509 RepID=A0A3N4IGJ1_ASCIM|nr:hypothetical protein BJ508DRAFT_415252 [Ascobolus immersus RN42]
MQHFDLVRVVTKFQNISDTLYPFSACFREVPILCHLRKLNHQTIGLRISQSEPLFPRWKRSTLAFGLFPFLHFLLPSSGFHSVLGVFWIDADFFITIF